MIFLVLKETFRISEKVDKYKLNWPKNYVKGLETIMKMVLH